MALQDELSSIDIDKDVNKLAVLPRSNAVIEDTLRLVPLAMTDGSHKSGIEGS
jgi:hypothetical protein